MSDFKAGDKTKVNHAGLVVKAESFVVEVVVDNQMIKTSMGGLNKESAITLMTIATCVNWPRLQGWNLYDSNGNCVASVDAVTFIGKLAEATPIGKTPADPKTAGWRALPVVTPTSDEFLKMIDRAKQEGTLPS